MGKVLFVSCTPVARYMIHEIMDNDDIQNVEVVGIVNINAEVAINKANYDPYHDLVKQYDIPIHYCRNINDEVTVQWMKDKKPDIIIQSGWSQKFNDEVLEIAKYACIGEHPAPLPKGRGAACVNWAIITGETKWGDTFFKMEQKYDTGLMYAQTSFTIEPYDDVKTVYDKVAAGSQQVMREHIEDWANGRLEGFKQDDSLATHYKRRRPKDGLFDFSQHASSIYNQIRGQARPYPGAFFMQDDKKVTVWRAAYDATITSDAPMGSVIEKCADGGVLIACGEGSVIKLLRVQVEGQAESWAVTTFA